MTIDQIREQFRQDEAGIRWDTSLASPLRIDVTNLIQTLDSEKRAQLQLFTATEENGSIRCGLEVINGNRAFHIRLAESIRNYLSREPRSEVVLNSEGATICRLEDHASYSTSVRLENAKKFFTFVDNRLNEWMTTESGYFIDCEKGLDRSIDRSFETYLYQENKEGSGKASSYLKGLEWLQAMLRIEPFGFEDALDLWSITSVERLIELRERVLEEQKKGIASPWVHESISKSYLRDNWCSGALGHLIEFLPQHQHASKALDLLHAHHGDEAALAEQLNQLDPEVPSGTVHDPSTKDGKDRLRETKTRIGQHAFREVILDIYQNRCCLTGLDLPALNRASHIIGWAEGPKTRMDPRNGLCLSATYDAAFDRKLITFDEDYRLVLSRTIREHAPSASLRDYFLNRAGQRIELPNRFLPLQTYLAAHRDGGDF